jgi:hypothetical protein
MAISAWIDFVHRLRLMHWRRQHPTVKLAVPFVTENILLLSVFATAIAVLTLSRCRRRWPAIAALVITAALLPAMIWREWLLSKW